MKVCPFRLASKRPLLPTPSQLRARTRKPLDLAFAEEEHRYGNLKMFLATLNALSPGCMATKTPETMSWSCTAVRCAIGWEAFTLEKSITNGRSGLGKTFELLALILANNGPIVA